MKFTIAFLLLTLIAPAEIVPNMIKSIYVPENTIVVEGVDDAGTALSLEFDKSKKVLKKTEKGEAKELQFAEIPLFLRLFFFDGTKTSPESMDAAAKSLSEILKNAGINTEVSSESVSDSDGSATVALGKAKRFSEENTLELSKESMRPSVLRIAGETYVFSDYHRSVMPLVFPGKIKFYKEGKLSGEWTFLRSEYRQK